MEPLDVEKLVGELEVAVDRLRSLYDQYFMGIEKLEPTVPRKDVERRIQVLRKEQIRNTAQRFRFQMILQRYNTYQTHWLRICREIENGTYKRHMMRAQQRFGDAQGAAGAAAGGKRASLPPPAAKPGAAMLTAELEAELAELDKEFAPARRPGAPNDDLELDVELEPEPPPRPPPAAPAPRTPAGSPPRAPPPLPPRGAASGAPQVPSRALPAQPAAPPRPVGPPQAGAVARPPAASPAASPAVPPRPQPPSGPARPAPPAAPPSPAPPPKGPAPTPVAAAHRTPDDLPDERVRELYSRYVDAKRKQNESTATITYEAVAKSLRESSAKLRQKHGKAVDFEVTVKDGKAILKPVLK